MKNAAMLRRRAASSDHARKLGLKELEAGEAERQARVMQEEARQREQRSEEAQQKVAARQSLRAAQEEEKEKMEASIQARRSPSAGVRRGLVRQQTTAW